MIEMVLITSLAIKLFLLINPIAFIPIVINMLKHFPPDKQKAIIFRESVLALTMMTAFCIGGGIIMEFLEISVRSTKMAGGVILGFMAMQMLFQEERDLDENGSTPSEPFLVPIAIPIFCGGGVISGILSFSRGHTLVLLELSILMAWLISAMILYSSTTISKYLGNKGMVAAKKIAGIFTLLIAIQLLEDSLLKGIISLR